MLDFTLGLGGRLVIFGGLAFAFALLGVAYERGRQGATGATTEVSAEAEAWRAEVTERLVDLGNQQRQLGKSLGQLSGQLQCDGLRGEHGANFQWCGDLRLHDHWSTGCAALVEQGALPESFQLIEPGDDQQP